MEVREDYKPKKSPDFNRYKEHALDSLSQLKC